jgi:ribosomal-protein-alanine N-acetyltransferase
LNFLPFPELETERLRLRRIVEADCEVILYLRSDEEINKYIERPENKKTKTKEDVLKHIQKLENGLGEGLFVTWGITILGDPAIIGTICLWNFSEDYKTAEAGYDMNPDFQGKGFMSEALKGILDYGFNSLNLDKVTAYTHNANEASKKLLTRNGFNLVEGEIDEGNLSNMIFDILKTNFK